MTQPAPARQSRPAQIAPAHLDELPPSILRGLDPKNRLPMTAEGRRSVLRRHAEATFGESFELLSTLTNGHFRVSYEMSDNPSGSTITMTTNVRSNRGLLYVINARLGDTPDQVGYSFNTQQVNAAPLKDPEQIVQFLTEALNSNNQIDPQRLREMQARRPAGLVAPAAGDGARP